MLPVDPHYHNFSLASFPPIRIFVKKPARALRTLKCVVDMKEIWLVTTDHLEKELWFRDDEDFKVGMNFVAIQAVCSPDVVLLAFILMSNHLHFMIAGEREDVESFFRQFKQRYGMYFNARWGVRKLLRRNGLDIREIPYEDEAPERAIAYVQMNCVAANICSHPTQYLWGTGNCFFHPENEYRAGFHRLGDLSARTRMRLFHTNCSAIPLSWHIGPEGFILPREYVDVRSVEALYRTPKRMNYFLLTSSKARKRLESAEHLPAFRDQTILAALPDLCRSLFGKESFFSLSAQEQKEFMRQLRFRFSADLNQIARVCGLTYAEAARFLDGF